ncbi:hypothetical protein EPI10_021708 [Gossypium australe]|uniref:Uncharacterized protein n=1 Tax=Gossypium australe TaxID=47621 RepID=A0A5B6WJJ2_9ROSI|nr:hypothetical protein EPI10_021708 [Gossypium australe]
MVAGGLKPHFKRSMAENAAMRRLDGGVTCRLRRDDWVGDCARPLLRCLGFPRNPRQLKIA